MFLGPGGSGKSSLLDGLMNQPLRPDESTALADTWHIKYQWVEAADAAEDAWKAVTEEDEMQEIAALSRLVVSEAAYIENWAKAQAVLEFMPVLAKETTLHVLHANQKYAKRAAQIHEVVTQSVTDKALLSNSHPEVVMHIWDCGGQPVFLDILSAFLTKRTMFLLLFDASLPLNSKYQEIWRSKGKKYPGKEQNITILQLMIQWMKLIHGSLVAKNEKGTDDKETKQGETTQDEANVERGQPSLLYQCPRMMIIGTHGDVPSKQQQDEVLKQLSASCEDMPFQDILECKLIVDNTTAGKKEKQDPHYRDIRRMIYDFTQSLTTPTPIAWVAFRKVLQNTVGDSPVLSYEEVIPIAEKCGIPKEAILSVLHFYHQLGVFLHYTKIELLSTTIIARPQWLIQQLCKLLMPDMFGSRPERLTRLWKILEGKGVLLECLYRQIWLKCELKEGAQALVDLLEYFDLAKEINSIPRELQQYKGRQYFVPCMLKARSQEGSMKSTTGPPQRNIREAETLHITFITGCIPPGFFVRLAARMINSERCTLSFERGMYRDSITFRFGELDRVTISEPKFLESVQVNFIRVARRERLAIHFAASCLAFRKELSTMCEKALSWFPSIEKDLAFRCSCSEHAGEHFAIINDDTHRESHVFCHFDTQCRMNSGHKYWLQPSPFTPQVST